MKKELKLWGVHFREVSVYLTKNYFNYLIINVFSRHKF